MSSNGPHRNVSLRPLHWTT